MIELSQKQTKIIRLGIKKRGVHLPALRDDLLDHICCLIEDEMSQTNDFANAYSNAFEKFESLKLLQDHTTQSIDESGISATVSGFVEYMITGIYLTFALLSFIVPLFLTVSHEDFSFLLLFSPFVLLGPFIIITRIDYRKFSIIPFKENIFPHSLVQ